MRMTGLEPARRGHRLLRPARLPIPPHPHAHIIIPRYAMFVKAKICDLVKIFFWIFVKKFCTNLNFCSIIYIISIILFVL